MPEAVSSSSTSKPGENYDLSDPRQKHMAAMEIVDCAHRFPDKGLGWFSKMRWGTASAYTTIFFRMEEDMKAVKFPFLALHDPKDAITWYSGSERLMELSPSEDKTLHTMRTGGYHLLAFVAQEEYLDTVASWIQRHV